MTDRRSLALLALLQVTIVALADPRGDFPLNDDWAYAHSVRWLLEEGRMRVSDWAAMNLLPQTLLGALAVAAFGFSFEVLRHVTQGVAALALFAAYGWFRALRFEPREALVATLVLAAFPAWPVLSNSYMTDLYGAVLAWASAAAFALALARPRPAWLAVATVLSMTGVLERQVALVVPFAYMAARLWTSRPLDRTAVAQALSPFACTLAAAFAYYAYLSHGPGVPEAQRVTNARLVSMTIDAFTTAKWARWAAGNALTMAGYLGLFAAGWMLWHGARFATRARMGLAIAGGVAAVAALAFGALPPYQPDNVIDAAGIGPFMLYDTVRGMAALDRDPGVLWRIAGAAAAVAAVGVVFAFATSVVRVVRDRRDADPLAVFLVAVLVAYLAPFVFTAYFDRYLLFALPFVIALWKRAGAATLVQHPWTRPAALAWIAAVIGLSGAATHDYFAWNRARWDAIRAAERLGASADSIDGGFEFNGFERFEIRPRESPERKSWYWVRDDLYVIAFSDVPGYDEVRALPVKRWLSRTPSEVKLLRRRP